MFGFNCHAVAFSKFGEFWQGTIYIYCRPLWKTTILGTMSSLLNWLITVWSPILRENSLHTLYVETETCLDTLLSALHSHVLLSQSIWSIFTWRLTWPEQIPSRLICVWCDSLQAVQGDVGKDGKRGSNDDESVGQHSLLVTGSVKSYKWLQMHMIVYFSGLTLCGWKHAPPCIGSDLLQRLNPKEHNKEEPSAIIRAAAYQRISAARCRSVA